MIGHLLGGAGAVEAIATILAINNNFLPVNLNFVTPDPECDVNIITSVTRIAIKTAISNSFGFGGANSTLVIQRYEN